MKKTLSALGMLVVLSFGTITAQSCNDNCCDNNGFYAGVDFLYWNAFKSDLDYAANNSNGFSIATTNGGVSEMHFAKYDWTPGVRVFVGYNDSCNGWDGRISYLHFNSKHTEQASFGEGTATENDHLKPTLWSPEFGTDRCQTAIAKVDLEFNMYDLTFGRTCCLCNNFTFRPFGGFRGINLEQHEHVEYLNGRDFTTNPGVVTWKSDYNAFGLTGGVDWNLSLCGGFGLYGTFNASIFAGETDDTEAQYTTDTDGNIVNLQINVNEKQYIGTQMYQLGLGLSYEGTFDCGCGCYDYSLGLGYEMNHLLNVPELRRYVNGDQEACNNGAGGKGCLLLHGLVIRAGFGF